MYTEKSLKHRKDPQIRSEGWRNYLFKPRKGTGTWESCGLQYFTEGAHQLWKSDRKSWGKKGCYYVLFFSDALFFSFFLSLFLSFFLFLSLFVCSQDKFSLCSPRCPGTHSVDKMALNSEKSDCLCLLNAGIKGVHHHHCLAFFFFFFFKSFGERENCFSLVFKRYYYCCGCSSFRISPSLERIPLVLQ